MPPVVAHQLALSAQDALLYVHARPTREGAPTFVFVNALTGSTDAWEAVVAPRLREQGFGTLSWNFRGQTGTAFAPDVALTDALIVGDLQRLMQQQAPERPVLVGLSIGGLYAARAVLAGTTAVGLVLLNTLREIGPRIAWINQALPATVGYGGVGLFMDALLPLLVHPDYLVRVRGDRLKGGYAPLDPSHGHMNLMRHSVDTDWHVPWHALQLPTLVVTGLADRVFLDLEVVERLCQQLPNARRLDWADAGHLLPQERPEQLAQALADFALQVGV